MPAIVVIGDAILDVHVRPAMPMEMGADVPAAIRLSPGGQGANLAVRLARQGLDVTLACALADDAAGDILRTALDADGVTRSEAVAEVSGVVVVLGGDGGERSMLSDRAPLGLRANLAIGLDAWLVVSGYTLLQEDGPPLAQPLTVHPGRRILVGCAVPDHLIDRWRAGLAIVRPDLVVANRAEADRLLPGLDLPGLAITDATGAEARIGAVRARADVPAGPAAVDTTGAGDGFAAGLLAGLAGAPWPPTEPVLRDAVARGVALATAVARQPGAQARVPGESASILRR
ncbi:MAG TPA: PfkB family carbohydrate kinase [Candidatus Limnocylindria bacterium]